MFISSLLLIKVKLEEVWLGGDQALVTCKRLLQTWKTLYDMEVERLLLKNFMFYHGGRVSGPCRTVTLIT